MRTVFIAAAATLGMTGLALADEAKAPSVMSDAQMDEIVGGEHRSILDLLVLVSNYGEHPPDPVDTLLGGIPLPSDTPVR